MTADGLEKIFRGKKISNTLFKRDYIPPTSILKFRLIFSIKIEEE